MKQSSEQAMAIMMARSPEWVSEFNGKEFDESSTAILRTYRNNTGKKPVCAAFAMTSADGEMVSEVVLVDANKNDAIDAVAKHCKLPASMVDRALAA